MLVNFAYHWLANTLADTRISLEGGGGAALTLGLKPLMIVASLMPLSIKKWTPYN